MVGRRLRQPRLAGEREEQALEVAAGVVRVGLQKREEVGEPAGAFASRCAGERGPDVVGVEAVQVVSALDGFAQRPAFEARGEVDDRSRWARHSQAVDDEGIEGVKARAVGRYAGVLAAVVGGRGDVDRQDRAVE
jgi:hypothetical protein